MFLLGYIDPGSGTMLLQVILAGIVAVPFFFRQAISNTWHRLRGERSHDSTPVVTERED
ncbi:hypothetical protein BH23CHL9_BH23CHL9_08340 [soil metagenome]